MVAIKAFSKEQYFRTKKGENSLLNEIYILRLLEHKNLLKLIEVYETKNSCYLVLQYLEG